MSLPLLRPVVSSTGGLGYGSCGGNGGAGAEETKGSVADDTWQRQGIELTYQDEVDIQERENILTAPVVFDERLVGAECQDFILKVRAVAYYCMAFAALNALGSGTLSQHVAVVR